MKAAVFHKMNDIRYEDVPDARLEAPTDAIVRVTATAICGSDLHIYNGYIPQLRKLTLGHEFMGIVEDVGPEVRKLKKGDRVVVPFPIACGQCHFCTHALPTACENSNPDHYGPKGGLLSQKGGALFGYTDLYGGYAGGQAEAVRVPYADVGPRKVPDVLTDEQVLFLTDILPTGWAGVDKARVQKGETVAVFGCGPVGLMAQKAAWIKGAKKVIGIDILPYRLNMAREACHSEVINAAEHDPVDAVLSLTDGRGADVCIDAVGLEANRNLLEKFSNALHIQAGTSKVVGQAFTSVRRGGRVSILGVYATTYDNFPLGQMMDKGIQVWAGQAPVHNYIDELIQMIEGGKIRTDDIITHKLKLKDVAHGYKVFCEKQDNCVKVVMTP